MSLLRQSIRRLPLNQIRLASTSTLTPASVSHIENRWEKLPESDRKDLIESLAERQKLPWTQLTAEEKKAAWYISFGEWGPRKPIHSAEDIRYIIWGTVIGVGITAAGFLYFRSKRYVPPTMNKEWQEQSDEYLKSKNANPFSGYSQVQSK
ncbi:unnamed protein product [Ambrosiozyma monospora]|uniref:Unnamed protein product n=1 Tax=Ambrosiozyma monospora TaxID=43982 RepID=A0ACB5T2B7_AMBMO|nr:unnamed protein product [Ambrosiozyma monospora]